MGRKRRGQAKVPKRFVKHIKSERLRALIKGAWERIPAAAREVIDKRLSGIYSTEFQATPGRISAATVGGVHSVQKVVIHGIELGDMDCHLWLDEARLDRMSPEAATAVIAHEFAHVALGHTAYDKAHEYWASFDPLTAAAIRSVHEWDSDLCIFLWGFEPELSLFGQETFKKCPPWWLTPKHGQPLTEKTTEEARRDKTETEGG